MESCSVFNNVYLGCDHAGFEVKEQIEKYLLDKGFNVVDLQPVFHNPLPYVSTARKVCKSVLKDTCALGILVCGTGVGISIAANRIRNIRAALLYDDFTAEYARRHNEANVLVFGARTMNIEDIYHRIEIFLSYEFEGGKYSERNRLLEDTGSTIEELEELLNSEKE